MSKVVGMILAGGVGARMGNVDKPKQFLELGDKPVIIHTVEKFVIHPRFDRIIVLAAKAWVTYTKDVIRKYIPGWESIEVVCGGESRNETIMNGIRYLEKNDALEEDTIIVTHDSVRPFVTYRILDDNIRYARQFGACDTAITASDTIVEALDNEVISNIPDRKLMYQGQTPQSFNAMLLKRHYESLTLEEKNILTDACKIMVLKKEHVHIVRGEVFNIKITYPYDLAVAHALLGFDLKRLEI